MSLARSKPNPVEIECGHPINDDALIADAKAEAEALGKFLYIRWSDEVANGRNSF